MHLWVAKSLLKPHLRFWFYNLRTNHLLTHQPVAIDIAVIADESHHRHSVHVICYTFSANHALPDPASTLCLLQATLPIRTDRRVDWQTSMC